MFQFSRIRLIGHRKDIEMLTFRALALRRSEGLLLETPAFESLYGGQYSLFQLSSLTQIFINCFISETKTKILSLSLYQRRLIRWACRPAPHPGGMDFVTSPKNVCVGGYPSPVALLLPLPLPATRHLLPVTRNPSPVTVF